MDPQTRTAIRYLGLEPAAAYPPDSLAVDVIAVALAGAFLLTVALVAGWLPS